MKLRSSAQLEAARLIFGGKGLFWQLNTRAQDEGGLGDGISNGYLLCIIPSTGPEISGPKLLKQLDKATNDPSYL